MAAEGGAGGHHIHSFGGRIAQVFFFLRRRLVRFLTRLVLVCMYRAAGTACLELVSLTQRIMTQWTVIPYYRVITRTPLLWHGVKYQCRDAEGYTQDRAVASKLVLQWGASGTMSLGSCFYFKTGLEDITRRERSTTYVPKYS